jgi:hypothetical protein
MGDLMTKFEETFGKHEKQPDPQPQVDEEALRSLADEFGGLAGWKCKEDNGGRWTQEGWDELMMRLYDNRGLLDGMDAPEKRGKAALDAMSSSPTDAVARLSRKLAHRRLAAPRAGA